MRAASPIRCGDLRLRHPGVFQAEGEVLAHAHMRVERIGLEHHGKAAVGGRDSVDHLAVDGECRRLSAFPTRRSCRSSVDFPQPEGPTKTTSSPSLISRLMPCSTSTAPKDFDDIGELDMTHDGLLYFSPVPAMPVVMKRCRKMKTRTTGIMRHHRHRQDVMPLHIELRRNRC